MSEQSKFLCPYTGITFSAYIAEDGTPVVFVDTSENDDRMYAYGAPFLRLYINDDYSPVYSLSVDPTND